MNIQRKVTAFVTRHLDQRPQLLVFHHAAAGVQIPAGTVEPGEEFEAAARREAREETGLDGLDLVAHVGGRTYELPDGSGVLTRETRLRARPDEAAPETSWSLGRVQVEVIDRRNAWARVVYTERDLDGDGDLVLARLEGWIRYDVLAFAQRREFYHLRTTTPTPELWRQQAEREHEFELFWPPLRPRPTGLVEGQQEWLDEFYEALL